MAEPGGALPGDNRRPDTLRGAIAKDVSPASHARQYSAVT
jgi:hypothetical protein